MSEMVERVARAIWRTRENQFPERVRRPEPDTFDNASGAWDMVLDQARAAIEAMRTMPPGMLSYLQMNTEIGAYVCANWAGAYSCMEEYHSKMIDAALKD